jgi:hypothetical protein
MLHFTDCIYDREAGSGVNSDNSYTENNHETSKAGPPINSQKFITDGSVTIEKSGDEIIIEVRMPMTSNWMGLHHYAVKSGEGHEEKPYHEHGMSDPKVEDF